MDSILRQLTIVIPFHFDCEERMLNLQASLQWMANWGCKILVMESGIQSTLDEKKIQSLDPQSHYIFIKATSEIFHRTQCINRLLSCCESLLVGVWDSDILVDQDAVIQACRTIIDNQQSIVYPYDGRFIMHSETASNHFRACLNLNCFSSEQIPCMGRPSCGGAFIVHRESYLAIGGENEAFQGWGPEDAERFHRCKILGWGTTWIPNAVLHHLYHPRHSQRDDSDTQLMLMREELIRICCMDREEILNERRTKIRHNRSVLPPIA